MRLPDLLLIGVVGTAVWFTVLWVVRLFAPTTEQKFLEEVERRGLGRK